jgi:ElaB/YqjD/DUF883 family membrane-anchored ribosome-binding protein
MARASNSRNTKDVDAIRADIDALKSDLGNLLKHVGTATAGRAEQLCGDLREQGADALRTQVRDLPITSMVLAFIAGTVAANIMRR